MTDPRPHSVRPTGREVALEKQVHDLESQVHGLSSLVADKLMEIDRLVEQFEALREALVQHHEISYRPVGFGKCPICEPLWASASSSALVGRPDLDKNEEVPAGNDGATGAEVSSPASRPS